MLVIDMVVYVPLMVVNKRKKEGKKGGGGDPEWTLRGKDYYSATVLKTSADRAIHTRNPCTH